MFDTKLITSFGKGIAIMAVGLFAAVLPREASAGAADVTRSASAAEVTRVADAGAAEVTRGAGGAAVLPRGASASGAEADAAEVTRSAFDFDRAWEEVDAAREKRLPRTVTNLVATIEREAIAAEKWQDAALAQIVREAALASFDDLSNDERLAAITASVEAQPEPLRSVRLLHLCQTYLDASQFVRWGGKKPTKLDEAATDAKDLPPWSSEKVNASVEKIVERVLAAEEILKKERIADWRRVIDAGNLPESYFPTLFDFAGCAAIGFYWITNPDKVWEKHTHVFNRLIASHKRDGNIDALACAEMELARYVRDSDAEPEEKLNADYMRFMKEFIAKYEKTSSVSAIAVADRAEMLREKEDTDLVALREELIAAAQRWHGTPGAEMCNAIAEQIAEPRLSMATENIWCDPMPNIEVAAANIKEVWFKLVKVSFEEIAARHSALDESFHSGISSWELKFAKREPVKVWREEIPERKDYRDAKLSFATPSELESGHYILFAATTDEFAGAEGKPLFVIHVTVTSLALVTASDKMVINGAVYLAEAGTPVAGARVEFWKDAGKGYALAATTATGEDGRFAHDFSKINENNWARYFVRAVCGEDDVVTLWTESVCEPHREEGRREQHLVDLFTDRAIYRPGQRIKVKGIASKKENGEWKVESGVSFEVALKDPRGKEVTRQKVKTNRWGSFTLEFEAPTDRLTGQYQIAIEGQESHWVQIEEYKRPKFFAAIDNVSDDAALGRATVVKGRALTYSGLPVQNAKVEWRISRATHYPDWFGSFYIDDEMSAYMGETVTDAEGAFQFEFTPEASPRADLSGDPSFHFEISASVTGLAGETRTAKTDIEIGTVAWKAEIEMDSEWLTAQKAQRVKISLNSFGGEPIAAKGVFKVYKLAAPERPVRKGIRESYWIDRLLKQPERGDWDWRNWKRGEEVASMSVATDAKGICERELRLGAGAYEIEFAAEDPNGKMVKGKEKFCVFDPEAKDCAIMVPDFFRAETDTVRVGETLRFYWGTGYGAGYCRVEVSRSGKKILDEVVRDTGAKLFEIPIKAEHQGGMVIRTTFVRENRVYQNRFAVHVPMEDKHLKIETEHLTSRLAPGDSETWKFKVSGPAEVLAFMFDRSLDAYTREPHDCHAPFLTRWRPAMSDLVHYNAHTRLSDIGVRVGNFLRLRSPDFVEPRWRELRHWTIMFWQRLTKGNRMAGFANAMMRLDAVAGESVADEEAVEDAAMCAPAVAPMMAKAAGGANDAANDAGGVRFCASDVPYSDEQSQVLSASFETPDDQNILPSEMYHANRTNLQETAFFFPQIETDEDGRLSFSFTVPDALTGWKLCILAHDAELRSGTLMNDTITTTKPLMCEPNAPRFAHEGDDFLFAVKVTNTTDAPQKGEVALALEIEGEGRAPARPRTGQQTHGSQVPPGSTILNSQLPFALAANESRSFEFRVKIPEGCGALKYVAKARGEKFTDGEEGLLPILSRRVLVRESVQLHKHGAGEKEFQLANLIASEGSETIRHRDLSVSVVSRPVWLAATALPYLMDFPHECCEQIFSRYYANTLGASIIESEPRLGDLFAGRDLKGDRQRALEKLRAARNADGLWPWFAGGSSSQSISLYILTGFARLNEKAGEPLPDFFADALAALDRDYAEQIARRTKNGELRACEFDARWLYLHSFKGVDARAADADARRVAAALRKDWATLDLETQARAAVYFARVGEAATANEIAASLRERATRSEEMGMYWKRPYFFSCSVFAAPVSTQSLIVEAFRTVGDEASAEEALVWLLKQRQTQDWKTTAATADAVYALLFGGAEPPASEGALAEVRLGGAKVEAKDAENLAGMFRRDFAADEIRPAMGNIVFSRTEEKGIAWGGVSWSYYEDVAKVRAHEPKELKIEKKYYKKVHGKDGSRLTAIEGALEVGDELVARLEITSDRTFEFVHIEDFRPACAEPVDVLSGYRWQDGVGYYLATRDTATHYYLDRLNAGKFVLETSFRVCERGTFAAGLATIECMYAPEFTAHSATETVEVK